MRFRRLELLRYGGFADRSIDFGDGSVDLHLVVGPNEAGKSTMLQAIGDLLFGIHGQSRQNWRYEYGDLRLRALLERDGTTLDVTRRKGNSKTLLGAEGSALPDDVLAPFLTGIDRPTFERMFGLDHGQLREGGEAILKGKDDTARIVLEAGTGISGIGAHLAGLTDAASTLFKPGGQNPEVNRLLRDRADAIAAVRANTLTDAAWAQQTADREKAERRLVDLRKERANLALRDRAIAQIVQARRPLARLQTTREQLALLKHLPDVPEDAESRLAAALSERASAAEVLQTHQATLVRIEPEIAAIALPASLLLHRATIDELSERRPVIETEIRDLIKREAELAVIDDRLNLARADAGLGTGATLPSAGWRARARAHVEAVRASETTSARLENEGILLDQAEAAVAEAMARTPAVDGLEALRAALADPRISSADRLVDAQSDVDAGIRGIAAALLALTPWHGEADALATIAFPSRAVADMHGRAIDTARTALNLAQQSLLTAEADGRKARAQIATLSASGTVPTADAIAAARNERDLARDDVLRRLSGSRANDDLASGALLVAGIGKTDLLADQRHADAERVAQHAAAIAAREEADASALAETNAMETATVELAKAEEQWTAVTVAAGFTAAIPPAGWSAWLADRTRALAAIEKQAIAVEKCDTLAANVASARKMLEQVLLRAGQNVSVDLALVDLVRTAAVATETLVGLERQRDVLETRAGSNLERRSKHAAELKANAAAKLSLDAERTNLLGEAGITGTQSERALADAIAALDTAAEDAVSHRDVARQVAGLKRDIERFESDTKAVFAALEKVLPGDSPLAVRMLAGELSTAINDEATLRALREDEKRAGAGITEAKRRSAGADTVVVDLIRLAQVEDEAALAPALAANVEARRQRDQEAEILAELDEIREGKSLEEIEEAVRSLSLGEQEAELAEIASRNAEIQAEIENLVQTLTEARLAVERVASTTLAAEAQQSAADATSGIVAAAERHVELATSAALLRWIIDRHRETSQAPLIKRAGGIFAAVTEGAFATLAIDYGDDDRPRIVGARADGSRVGIEGLSEGTRDQLYLALRLASIEGRAAAGTLPLICDDLLITADDGRSGAMLKVLANASATTQVVLFTHHEHLIEVARRSIGPAAFKLHQIERVPSASA